MYLVYSCFVFWMFLDSFGLAIVVTRLHYAAARSDKEAVTRLLGICESVEAQTRPVLHVLHQLAVCELGHKMQT